VLALALAACQATAAEGLSETEAREALAALGRAGVAAGRAPDGDRTFRVEVAGGDQAHAAEVLRAWGLPRLPAAGFRALYAAGGLVPTAAEEHARRLAALGGEIAHHLLALDGVADASAIVAEPFADPLVGAAPAKVTASIVVRLVPDAAPAWSVADVQRLVAAAADRLAPADVAVIVVHTPAPAAAPPYAQVGPIQVAPSQRALLVAVLAGALCVILVLAAWVIHAELRRARQARQRKTS
jgi:type III secretion system YscJ/HrcJ family lipoprotein